MPDLVPQPESPRPEPLEGVLEPWTKKVTILVCGTRQLVPENQDMIRILQYLGCLDVLGFYSGHYCWNATCNNCIFTFRDPRTGEVKTQRSCQTRVQDGLEIVHLPKDVHRK